MCVCVLFHAGRAALCATMLRDCTAVSINLKSKGSDHVCLSSFKKHKKSTPLMILYVDADIDQHS